MKCETTRAIALWQRWAGRNEEEEDDEWAQIARKAEEHHNTAQQRKWTTNTELNSIRCRAYASELAVSIWALEFLCIRNLHGALQTETRSSRNNSSSNNRNRRKKKQHTNFNGASQTELAFCVSFILFRCRFMCIAHKHADNNLRHREILSRVVIRCLALFPNTFIPCGVEFKCIAVSSTRVSIQQIAQTKWSDRFLGDLQSSSL